MNQHVFASYPKFSLTYFVGHLLHGLLMLGTNSTFMVTKNGDLSVAIVVELDLLVDSGILVFGWIQLLEEIRHGVRSIVGTEDLGSQALHVV